MKIPKARKLPSGNYRIQLRLTEPDGSQRSISITEATEKLCQARAAAIKGGLIEEQKTASGTLGAAIDEYIRLRDVSRSPATIRGYKGIRKQRFQDYMSLSLSRLNDKLCQQIVDEEAAICSPKTLENAWALVSSAIEAATGKKFKPNLAPPAQKEMPWLDYEQVELFCKAAKGDTAEIPMLLALNSLRRSELAAITWDKVDLKKELLFVRGAVVYGADEKRHYKAQNKNQTSARITPILIPRLLELLKAVPEDERQGSIVHFAPNTVTRRINKICSAIGLPEVGSHGLRRSFASLCYHLKISEQICMQWGGWSDWGTMRKIYTKTAEADKSEAAEAVKQFFKNAQKKTQKKTQKKAQKKAQKQENAQENAHENAHENSDTA